MLNEQEKIDLITQISLDINKVKDLDLLLESILTNSRTFFNADAGSIYLKEGDELKFSYAQNATLEKRLGPGKKLIYTTFTVPINSSSIAGYVAKNCESVNIPDAYKMSTTVPYTWDSEFDKVSHYTTRSMLTVPMTTHRGEVLGVMQLINAQDDRGVIIPFSSADESLIMHFATSAALALERAQMTRNIILRMISMAELRDPKETGAHVNRVAAYSVEIYETWAREQGISPEEVQRHRDILRMAAMLHDVGKVAISDLILKKPDRLSAEEFETIKSHTYLGARLFKDVHSDFEEVAAEVALNHHEKWDGTGYPGYIDPITGSPLTGHEALDGSALPKRENEIPLFGRIVAVADVYDALRSRRSYKEPWNEDRILSEMQSLSGTHFDPELITAFFSCLDVLKSIAERYPDSDEL
ncbi:MAG: phosphohydrolase [Deltaproteobacteria bacterium]|nr:HD domain-containing protein [Deltaproteobacteria bacterium]RLB29434.1 MAG: phosphohydrolase [Deltaproteobacteria bacterium]